MRRSKYSHVENATFLTSISIPPSMRVGWSSSHGEFLIDDYYYFSKLKQRAEEQGIRIVQESSFYRLERYDVIIFNYPERRFRIREAGRIRSWLKKGKTVIFTSYYNNIDGVSEVVNRVLERIGSNMRLNLDTVRDYRENYRDPMLPVGKWRQKSVVMPCTSSIEGGSPLVRNSSFVFGSYEEIHQGKIAIIGTCVFWDNFTIDKLSNTEFAISLLGSDL